MGIVDQTDCGINGVVMCGCGCVKGGGCTRWACVSLGVGFGAGSAFQESNKEVCGRGR